MRRPCLFFMFVVFFFLFFDCCSSFVSKRHILSNSSAFKWSDASWRDQWNSPSKFCFLFMSAYLFVLHWDFLPLDINCGPTEAYFVWVSVPAGAGFVGIVIIFYPSCLSWVGTDNWVGTSRSLVENFQPSSLRFYLQVYLCHLSFFILCLPIHTNFHCPASHRVSFFPPATQFLHVSLWGLVPYTTS